MLGDQTSTRGHIITISKCDNFIMGFMDTIRMWYMLVSCFVDSNIIVHIALWGCAYYENISK